MNKILLVDDDRELTSLLKELLEMEGFNVIVAHDGEQALDLLDDSIDLLLLDVMMPKKNGIDTLKALRQTHQTPVIMLTARGSELDRAGQAYSALFLSCLCGSELEVYPPNHLIFKEHSPSEPEHPNSWSVP